MSNTNNGVLGKIVQHPIDRIETLPSKKAVKHVRAICGEVTALCPVTGQPDIYTITIDYDVKEQRVIESKALKLFLWQYRDVGISCEDLSADIAQKLSEQYGAEVTVHARQQSRGGIVLESTSEGSL